MADNFSMSARAWNGLRHTLSPAITAPHPFGRSQTHKISVSQIDVPGATGSILQDHRRTPKSGMSFGGGLDNGSPIVGLEDLPGNAPAQEPSEMTERQQRSQEMSKRPSQSPQEWNWQATTVPSQDQRPVRRPAVTSPMSVDHPLTGGLVRRAIGAPTGGSSGAEPPTLQGTVLPRSPLGSGPAGVALDLFAE